MRKVLAQNYQDTWQDVWHALVSHPSTGGLATADGDRVNTHYEALITHSDAFRTEDGHWRPMLRYHRAPRHTYTHLDIYIIVLRVGAL